MNNIEFINDAYTEDELRLPMIHFNTEEKDICVIFIHGMCQTIIDNYFATVWGNILSKNGIGFLYEHNRGHSIENDILMKDGSYKRCGCMYEIFEDSIYDIELAINKAKENIDKGNPTKILSNLIEDYMYMSSQTYYSWFKKILI